MYSIPTKIRVTRRLVEGTVSMDSVNRKYFVRRSATHFTPFPKWCALSRDVVECSLSSRSVADKHWTQQVVYVSEIHGGIGFQLEIIPKQKIDRAGCKVELVQVGISVYDDGLWHDDDGDDDDKQLNEQQRTCARGLVRSNETPRWPALLDWPHWRQRNY